jgi:hypothetical protein
MAVHPASLMSLCAAAANRAHLSANLYTPEFAEGFSVSAPGTGSGETNSSDVPTLASISAAVSPRNS